MVDRSGTAINVQKSYLSNYLRVYIWQGLSVVTSFLSMFVVLPLLTSRPAMFGIYSLCMSMTIFVSYADFGFMSAGFRYASQCLVKGDLRQEVRIVGFVSFILLMFVLLHATVVAALAVHPPWLIAHLSDPQEIGTARALLMMLAIFSPVIALQRMLQIVFGIRIEDYIYYRISIVGNLLKIGSLFLFVNAAGYNIVGYFVACQVVALVSCIAALAVAVQRYRYDLVLLLRSIRFSRDIYDATKRLAFNSLYVTLAWVVFYEFDSLFVGKVLGADALAIYAVALSLLSFFRTLSSIIFAPFRARINHFVALGDHVRLRGLYQRTMAVTLPAAVFPVVSLIVLMRPFILCWTGDHYLGAVIIAQLLILNYLDGFSSNPATYALVAQERVRELYVIGSIAPVILWGAVLVSYRVLDITLFSFLKFASALPAQIAYLYISATFLKASSGLIRRIIVPAVPPVIALVLMLLYVRPFLPVDKGSLNVAIVTAAGGCASGLALLIYYGTSVEFRTAANAIASMILGRRRAGQFSAVDSSARP